MRLLVITLLSATTLLAAPPAKEVVVTKDAPSAAGPYSQAVKAGGLVFVSGYIARDPATNKLVEGDVKAQTDGVLKNVSAVLAAAGSSLEKAVKANVYLRNASDFAAMNEVYAKFFPTAPPARTTIQAILPNEAALVEIDIVALQ